jgi:hypothetical protein
MDSFPFWLLGLVADSWVPVQNAIAIVPRFCLVHFGGFFVSQDEL